MEGKDERYQLSFHWIILCYMERYYATHRKMPSIPHMRDTFNQRRNADIWDRLQLLVKRGYLRKNPGYRLGTRDDAYWFGKERINCDLIGDMSYCEYVDSLHSTKWKKQEEALEVDEYGTTWVGNE